MPSQKIDTNNIELVLELLLTTGCAYQGQTELSLSFGVITGCAYHAALSAIKVSEDVKERAGSLYGCTAWRQ